MKTTAQLHKHLAEMGTELRGLLAQHHASLRSRGRMEPLSAVIRREVRLERLQQKIDAHHAELLRRG